MLCTRPHNCPHRWVEPITERSVRILRLNLAFAYMLEKITAGADAGAKAKFLTERLETLPDHCAQFFKQVGSSDMQKRHIKEAVGTGCHCVFYARPPHANMACCTAIRHCHNPVLRSWLQETRALAYQHAHAHLSSRMPRDRCRTGAMRAKVGSPTW